MRFGGFGPRLALRSPQLLHVALYIRDTAGIRISGDSSAPPPLRRVEATRAPSAQVHSGGLGVQWMDWWRWIAEHEATAAAIGRDASFGGTLDVARQIVGTMELAFDPPEFASLTGSPDLRALVAARHREALDWWSRLDVNGSLDGGESAAHGIPIPIIQRAAETVATERGVPVDGLAADIGVLEVTGTWSQIVAPGYVLCSADLTRDVDVAEGVVRRAFWSGLDGSSSGSAPRD